MSSTGGDLPEPEIAAAKAIIDEFADVVAPLITQLGFRTFDALLWRPWNLLVIQGPDCIYAAFTTLTGGIATLHWSDWRHINPTPQTVVDAIRDQVGWNVETLVVLPLPGDISKGRKISLAAEKYAAEVDHQNRFKSVGDVSGIPHLVPHLHDFLADHPNFDKNVFIMMRFLENDQLDEVHAALKSSLNSLGFDAVRADDRDYTGELWSNIEVYMTGSRYGIAVFEDFTTAREFNPNVSLELGYMLGRRKRVLLLKEQTLPHLPADVVHRLYKPFDKFRINDSITREITNWIRVDLGH
jgi:hypothetical protein